MEKIDFDKIKINKDEVLRYLGHKNQILDAKTEEVIDECIKNAEKYIDYRYIYKIFSIEKQEEGIFIKGTNLALKGESIREHLRCSKECALMIVTLGNNIDKMINLYERNNLTKALIMDSCATVAIETACDLVEERIKYIALKYNKKLTYRYSPGYGDLSIEIQKPLINVLNAERKIGVTVSNTNLLLPRKSVTAIVGFIPEHTELLKKSCRNCSINENCKFRKEGINCGN